MMQILKAPAQWETVFHFVLDPGDVNKTYPVGSTGVENFTNFEKVSLS